jgi:hypothetical protein
MRSALVLISHKASVLESILTSAAVGRKLIENIADIGKDDNILITRQLKAPAVLDIASALDLHQYNSRALVIQNTDATRDDINDCISVINQLKQYGITALVVGQDSIGSLHTVISQLFKKHSQPEQSEQAETTPVRKQELRGPDIITKTPGGKSRDTNDLHELRHGRKVHEGHLIGQYLQSPPMFFSRDGHPLWCGDMYRGRSAFLILGGPSFSLINKALLNKPGVLTMAVNNCTKSFRPDLWISVDDPGNFIKSIWLDPKITKFVPFSHSEKKLFDSDAWKETNIKTGDCPNVWYYRRNEHFVPEQYLFEDTINWGNHKDHGGGRSIMLAALRILFYLGIRTVYLLGCDFKMDSKYKYHFEQDRAQGSIKGNNTTYQQLIERFEQLKSIFDRYGYKIFNCNPESGLKTFPIMKFEEAISMATIEMPINVEKERTLGLYERQAELRKEKKQKEKREKELGKK